MQEFIQFERIECMIRRISDIDRDEISDYMQTSEVQLLRCMEPEPGVFIAESPNVIRRAVAAGYEPMSFLVEECMVGKEGWDIVEKYPDIPVYVAPMEIISSITGYKLTRGLLCKFKRKELLTVSQICSGAKRIAVLEDVVNPTNVGAIFRSAAALGMDAVILTAGCSNPLYRRAARVSMGNVFLVPWTIMKKGVWPEKGMEELRAMGFKTAAMTLSTDSISVSDELFLREDKLAIVLGTEGDGLAPKTIAGCDFTVKIPMTAGVDSLNVAAASAVVFWELGKISRR